MLLTSWSRSLGVREQDNATLALLYKFRKGRLIPIVGLYLTAKGSQVNRVANLGRTAFSRSGAIGLADDSLLDSFHLLSNSFLDLLNDRLFGLRLLALGRRLLFSWAHWRWGSFLAFAKLDRHGGNGVEKLESASR